MRCACLVPSLYNFLHVHLKITLPKQAVTCVPVRCTEQKAAYPVCPAHPFGCGGRSTYRPRPRAIYICCACMFPSIPPLYCSHLQSVFAPVSSYCSFIYSMWKGLPSPILNAFSSLSVAIVTVSTYIGSIILTSS
jgi:hypothetical protein